jgi:hypothetical protein
MSEEELEKRAEDYVRQPVLVYHELIEETNELEKIAYKAGAKAERERILGMMEEIDREMENAEEVSAEAYNDGVEVFVRLLKQRLGNE